MKILFLILTLIISFSANAFTYKCEVVKKYSADLSKEMTSSELKKWKFSIEIVDAPKPVLKRCSLTQSTMSVSCDSYDVDRVEFDSNVNIKKFYVFRSQFDVQLFSDMNFIENNGRGGIAFGKCQKQ